MKATGIVRRIDDLGRVVIPKEIRRTMRIREGDPLEIYTDKEGGVIFKKYSLMGGLSDFAAQMCETLHKTTGHVAVITDRDTCIAVAGTARRELADKRVSAELENVMEGRQIFQAKEGEEMSPICEDADKFLIATAAPILSEGDVLGCVLFAAQQGDAPVGEIEYKLVQTIAGFLGKHMES
ncbi:MAG: AbrB/MazE/SpoVT family DNA-binding domain-containing protein [Clostridia bacterium]|nr:AbrB/MazE/SpoVT family DNA-binding domain-containing protein [Clostridia bacterium]